MKTNNDMLHGGKLKPEFAQAWANYYTKFIKAYEREGIPIWGITRSERADGDADVGVVHLHRRRRARLPEELPRPDDEARRAGRQEDHRLGSQPRSHLPARQHHPRRSRSRAVRVGHRLPLVRAVERRRPDVRQRQARARDVPRQEADLHRGHASTPSRPRTSTTGGWASTTAAR